MASLSADHHHVAGLSAATNDSSGTHQALLAPLQEFFQGLARSREEKARRVVNQYLAKHGDEELLRCG